MNTYRLLMLVRRMVSSLGGAAMRVVSSTSNAADNIEQAAIKARIKVAADKLNAQRKRTTLAGEAARRAQAELIAQTEVFAQATSDFNDEMHAINADHPLY